MLNTSLRPRPYSKMPIHFISLLSRVMSFTTSLAILIAFLTPLEMKADESNAKNPQEILQMIHAKEKSFASQDYLTLFNWFKYFNPIITRAKEEKKEISYTEMFKLKKFSIYDFITDDELKSLILKPQQGHNILAALKNYQDYTTLLLDLISITGTEFFNYKIKNIKEANKSLSVAIAAIESAREKVALLESNQEQDKRIHDVLAQAVDDVVLNIPNVAHLEPGQFFRQTFDTFSHAVRSYEDQNQQFDSSHSLHLKDSDSDSNSETMTNKNQEPPNLIATPYHISEFVTY